MTTDTVKIAPLDDPLALAGEMAEIYHSALGTLPDPPALVTARHWAEDMLPRHVGQEAFRCVGAFAQARLVGFIYGYHGARGQHWEDWLAGLMAPELYARWLGDHFSLVEFHVRAEHHGQGVGRRLYDALFAEPVPYPRAVLTTRTGDTPARRFYAHRGWQLITQVTDRYTLLGREPPPHTGELPLRTGELPPHSGEPPLRSE